jgi:hypothetical protein
MEVQRTSSARRLSAYDPPSGQTCGRPPPGHLKALDVRPSAMGRSCHSGSTSRAHANTFELVLGRYLST